jgi:hypothetical protein
LRSGVMGMRTVHGASIGGWCHRKSKMAIAFIRWRVPADPAITMVFDVI